MRDSSLQTRILAGRSARIDWFAADVQHDHLIEVLVAMANSRHGGTVILGVDPVSSEIRGIGDPTAAIDRVLQAALALTPPLIIPMPQVTLIADQAVLSVEIPRGCRMFTRMKGVI